MPRDREQKQHCLRYFHFKDVMATVSNFICPRQFAQLIFKYCLSLLRLQCGFLLYLSNYLP